jgi:hypothetical protein
LSPSREPQAALFLLTCPLCSFLGYLVGQRLFCLAMYLFYL